MGRNKKYNDIVLNDYYSRMVRALKDSDGFLYAEQMAEITDLNKAQIGKALQYGRRQFDGKNMKITDYIMASSNGYFLPSRGKEVIAYVVQNALDARSRVRTLRPIYEYAKEKWGDELNELLTTRLVDDDSINDEMHPWEIFNQIMEFTNI